MYFGSWQNFDVLKSLNEEKAATKRVKIVIQKLIVGCFDTLGDTSKAQEIRYKGDGYMMTQALNKNTRKTVRKISRKKSQRYIKMGTWNVRGT